MERIERFNRRIRATVDLIRDLHKKKEGLYLRYLWDVMPVLPESEKRAKTREISDQIADINEQLEREREKLIYFQVCRVDLVNELRCRLRG